tara:strand:- start:27217 stop:27804 length:588 start_codon:yes stop_codon:yes gene_type:complete
MFDNILLQGLRQGITPARTKAARSWYRNLASEYTRKISPSEALKRTAPVRKVDRIKFGYMYAFKYDPKLKKTLPYYDTFPLIFPIDFQKGHMLGINFHYLPPPLRAKLMDAIYPTVTNRKYDETTRVQISYGILKSASKYKAFKPTVKMYLPNHIRSQFIEIYATQWDLALFLPTASFRKAPISKVWEDSRKRAR